MHHFLLDFVVKATLFLQAFVKQGEDSSLAEVFGKYWACHAGAVGAGLPMAYHPGHADPTDDHVLHLLLPM